MDDWIPSIRTIGNKCLVWMKDSSINVHTNIQTNCWSGGFSIQRWPRADALSKRAQLQILKSNICIIIGVSFFLFLFFFSKLLFAFQHIFDRLVGASIHLGTNLHQHFIHQGAVFGLLGNYQFAKQINPHSLAKQKTMVTWNLRARQVFSNHWTWKSITDTQDNDHLDKDDVSKNSTFPIDKRTLFYWFTGVINPRGIIRLWITSKRLGRIPTSLLTSQVGILRRLTTR